MSPSVPGRSARGGGRDMAADVVRTADVEPHADRDGTDVLLQTFDEVEDFSAVFLFTVGIGFH